MSRWRRVALGLAVLLALGGCRAGPGPEPARSVSSPLGSAGTVAGRVADALAALTRAVTTGPAPTQGPFASTLARNARALRVENLSFRYAGDASTDASGGVTALADVSWRLAGVDRRVTTTRVTVRLDSTTGRPAAAGRDGWRVASISGAGERWPLWLAGPVAVRRAPGVLALVAGEGRSARWEARRTARLGERALVVVRRVLPRARRPLVIEVPATTASLRDHLSGSIGEYDDVAAVTTTADARTDADAPVRVYLDRTVFDPLGARARLVVLAHETTHLETGAATAVLPLWLLEGFADHVALRDVGLPLTTLAAHALAAVRRDGPPVRLPPDAAFGGAGAEAAYEEAWLACRVLVERGGERRLVRLDRAVTDGEPVGRALHRIFGTSQRSLTLTWRSRLVHWAG